MGNFVLQKKESRNRGHCNNESKCGAWVSARTLLHVGCLHFYLFLPSSLSLCVCAMPDADGYASNIYNAIAVLAPPYEHVCSISF